MPNIDVITTEPQAAHPIPNIDATVPAKPDK